MAGTPDLADGHRLHHRPRRVGSPDRRRPATRRDRRRRRAARPRRHARRGHLVAGHALPTDPAEARQAAASWPSATATPAAIGYYLDHGRVHVGDLDHLHRQRLHRLVSRPWPRPRLDHARPHPRAGHRTQSAVPAPTALAVGAVDPRPTSTPRRRLACLGRGPRSSAASTTARSPSPAPTGSRTATGGASTHGSSRGAVEVTHLRTGRIVTLPADYVRGTSHSATPPPCTAPKASPPTPATPSAPARNPANCSTSAITRGRHANHLYLTTAGDGDPHSIITRDALLPPTAGDILARALQRDDAPVSAATAGQQLADPTSRLQAVAERYHHALTTAAEDRLGVERLAEIDTAAGQRRPGPHPMRGVPDVACPPRPAGPRQP